MEKDYVTVYEAFIKTFSAAEVSGGQIGEFIVQMTSYYMRYNLELAKAIRAYHRVVRDFQNQVDATTGKAMSSAKADALSSGTEEAAHYEETKIDVQNLEQAINSLKSLQRGAMNEMGYQA